MKPLNVFEVEFEGFNLVEASAGTGKTYNITSLYVRSIVEFGWVPSKILALTYTEDATSELKQRIRSRIEECIHFLKSNKNTDDDFLNKVKSYPKEQALKRLESALFSFDEAVISTIHGFCQQLLREYSLEFGIQSDFEILKDTSEVLQEAVDKYWRGLIREYSVQPIKRGILSLLADHKVNPENLRFLLNNLLSKPYAKITPETISEENYEKQLKGISDLFNQLSQRWDKDKHEVLKILNSGNLNGRSYKSEKFEVWISQLEQFLHPETIDLSPFSDLKYFSASFIEDKANNGYSTNPPLFCNLVDNFLDEVENLSKLVVYELHKAIKEIQSEFKSLKTSANALSFDDLLQITEQNLNPDIRRKVASQFKLALIDEFQDTDPIQYSIFRKLFFESNSALFMIGDPKQAIYSFRGADLFTYFKATEDISDEKKYSLSANYRSSINMISAVNQVFKDKEQPFLFKEPEFREVVFPDGKVSEEINLDSDPISTLNFVECNSESTTKAEVQNAVISYVSGQIHKLLKKPFRIDEKFVQTDDIAILVRKRKWITPLQNALSELGIKSAVKSKASVFRTNLSEQMLLLMRSLSDHTNTNLIRAALVTDLIGYNANKILGLEDEPQKWSEIQQIFDESVEIWKRSGILDSFRNLDSYFGIKKNIARLRNSERLMTDYNHILELLSEEERRENRTIGGLIRFHRKKLNDESTLADEDQIRLESDKDHVTITTLHSSKGLEYPITFLPDLWEDFDSIDYRKINYTEYHNEKNQLCIDIRKKPSKDISDTAKKEKLADLLRLNYVGLTRSKNACFIPFGWNKDILSSPLIATALGTDYVLDKKKKEPEDLRDEFGIYQEKENIEYKTAEEALLDSKDYSRRESSNQEKGNSSLSVLKNKRNDLYLFPRIMSFSSLASHQKESNDEKYDEFNLDVDPDQINDIEDRTITKLNFPKGKHTGNLLHYIFENIEFDEPEKHSEIIQNEIRKAGLEESLFPIVEKWIRETLDHELVQGIKLSNLPDENVLKEMEFHFTVNSLNAAEVFQTIRSGSVGEFIDKDVISGYMKGFIDLTFRFNDKYYILDYKSNYLGEDEDSYSKESLQAAMQMSGYDLQYHIYALALKKFLESREPRIQFDEVFGGVIYLFMRGIDKKMPESGVYFTRPEMTILEDLNRKMGISNE